MSSLTRNYDIQNHREDIVVAVRTAGQSIAQQATAALYFLAFLAVWTAVFYLALR